MCHIVRFVPGSHFVFTRRVKDARVFSLMFSLLIQIYAGFSTWLIPFLCWGALYIIKVVDFYRPNEVVRIGGRLWGLGYEILYGRVVYASLIQPKLR